MQSVKKKLNKNFWKIKPKTKLTGFLLKGYGNIHDANKRSNMR